MYEKAAEFVCSNKEYFNLDSPGTMLIVAVVALSSKSFDTVNMLYGIFLTEKTRIDRLRNTLSIYTREASAFLLDVNNYCHHDHECSFYASCAKDNDLENMDTERRRMFEKNTREPIDSFKNKFFIECDVLNLCKGAELADDMSDNEILELSKKIWTAVKCICDYGSLKSVKDGKSIYFVCNTMDMNAALDYEHNIETNFITDEIISRGRMFLNRFDLMNSKINNLKYRTTYSIVNGALAQKAAHLYAENMSEVISDIIKDKPEKYRELLKKKWDESKAEKLFIRAFKEHENTAEISNYIGRCFIHRNFDNNEKARNTGLLKYFQDSYINAGERYGEILECPDAKRLLLTAEWLWNKECENVKDIHSDTAGHEFTYLVANYLKAVEIFLVHKLEKAAANCRNDIMAGQVNRNLPNIKVGSEGWREKVTMGNLNYCVRENPELLDPELHSSISAYLDKYNLYPNNSPVSIYLEDFVNDIRNGYFHKHTLLTFGKASEIRGRTLFVLRRITADIK